MEKMDCPPLLPEGAHSMTLERIKVMAVDAFPLSTTRSEIYAGFLKVVTKLKEVGIVCDLLVDGSFLTEEIDPDDVDFAVCVTPEFYDSCTPEQRSVLDWIRDDFSIKGEYLSDCNLCVEYPKGHPEYFDGIQNREFWLRWYRDSIIYKRKRGVVVVSMA